MTSGRPGKRDWLVGVAAGVTLGLIFLGVGGRAAMRIIALATNQPPGFSFGGTMTVVLLGAATGAVMAAVFLLGRTLFPRHRWVRAALFWSICLALTLRGLSPVTTLAVSLFVPLVLLHGALLYAFWCRVYVPRAR